MQDVHAGTTGCCLFGLILIHGRVLGGRSGGFKYMYFIFMLYFK